jgi:para-nitrobenzyl esterase
LNAQTGAPGGNEDCLLLNVWTPISAAHPRGLPVIVWLHPGAFQAASSNLAGSNGARVAAERNAVVVAPNYRLGPFGFLAHPLLTSEDPAYPSSGNYGIVDQRAALRWIGLNIAAFGGDPANVTLAGNSAGAESTSMHLVSPGSRGWFHRAILQSGHGLMRARTLLEAEAQGEAFAHALGCTDRSRLMVCMRAATRDQVLAALEAGQAQVLEGDRVDWGPVVDGREIPDQPRDLYRRGQFTRVPVMVGTNADEGWTFVERSFPGAVDSVQYDQTVRREFGLDANAVLATYPLTAFATPKDALARLIADVEFVCEARRLATFLHHDGAPVYRYSFEYPLAGFAGNRVLHGLEPNFLFGNDFGVTPNLGILTPQPLTAADERTYAVMSTYWRQFADRGNPNPTGMPVEWPSYRPGDHYLAFGDRVRMGTFLRDSQCNFWEPFFYRSALRTVPAAAR